MRLTVVTPAAGIAYGFDPFALLGKPLTALFAFGDHEEAMLPLLRALASGSALLAQPARLRGSGRGVMLSAAFRAAPAGGFAGFVGSARMADEAPASLANAVADRLDDALRRPLARIVADADGLAAEADAVLPPGYSGYADDIAHAGRHLMGLVDDLAEMRAVERPDFALPVVAIDVAALAARAAGLCAGAAAQRGVTVDIVGGAGRAAAMGDDRRVVQVLVNLIGNAVRYAPAGSRVTVAPAIAGARAQVTVADTGPGIAVADQPRIFDKFERVDPLEPGGTGLGLYIARRLARAMGGDLTVDSVPGDGACFTLDLAAAPA